MASDSVGTHPDVRSSLWDRRRFLAVVLVLLGCVGFQWNTEHAQLTMPAIWTGVGVAMVVAVVLLYRIVGALERVCLDRGFVRAVPAPKYDVLLAVAFLAVLPHLYWDGELIVGTNGQSVPQWYFQWSRKDNGDRGGAGAVLAARQRGR